MLALLRTGSRTVALVAGAALWIAGPAFASDDMDDVLGGFEDDDLEFELEEVTDASESRFDLSGSVEVSGTVNLRRHRSATGTNYYGLQRLRNRLNLELDVDLVEEWQLRVSGWAFWDAAYLIQRQGRYTDEVRDAYEVDYDLGETWIQGQLFENLDVKVGRQVVIWGRSDTLRVLDVLNPLDNREPGRVDLEDLRRPVGMLKLDGYLGDWSLSAIYIPEIRTDDLPELGSDFFPVPFDVPVRRIQDFKDPEFALALEGIFSGWDVAFHVAWFWNDTPRFRTEPGPIPMRLVHDRLWMFGTGGNYTTGSWLFKYELALFDGLEFFGSRGDKQRLDALVGIEYYGFNDTTITIEGLNRHLFDHSSALKAAPDFVRENTQQISARITRDFWNDRLHASLLALIVNFDARDGSIVRADLDYDLRDALSVGVGIILYQKGDLPPLDAWSRNDRAIFNVKWSF